jgi:EmrB/QacA subfamily drug resistance transporter
MFVLGLLLFTGASALAAVSHSANALDVARAIQGVGGAIVTPLTLTILSAAVRPEQRGLALGIWGGIGGLAIAVGPLVGGAIVDGVSWHWIFWVNVPIGLVLAPLAGRRLEETRGADGRLDLPGLALASVGLLGIVWGLVRGNAHGWTSVGVVTPLVAGALLVAAFVWWELRAPSPMLPMHFFRDRVFALTNVASLLMFFGMFGSIFLLAQFFQTVQHLSPLQSGLRILPWTAMPMFIAPIAGALSDRIGGQRLMTLGLVLQSAGLFWIAAVQRSAIPYADLVGPFMLSGAGMALFFAPVANVVLGSVRPEHEGKASGANNAIRELGGVFGVAVLAAVFSHVGGYRSGTAFTHGTTSAVWVGASVVLAAAAAAALIPRRRPAHARSTAAVAPAPHPGEPVPASVPR